MAAAGAAFVAICYFILVPALIVGFLLTLKKKVWKCASCGFLFERG
jgi:hypothetical protein